MTHEITFGIVGYSTRALVQAVVDLGHRAIAIDAFGDQDTIDRAASVHVVADWPGGVMPVARTIGVDAWLLAGGMENCEQLLMLTNSTTNSSLADVAPILGPSIDQMQTLRSPHFCESLCSHAPDRPAHSSTIHAPTVYWPSTCLSPPEDNLTAWLVKPMRSAGGVQVRHACMPGAPAATGLTGTESHYWQRRIDGRVLGVTWIMQAHECHVHGVTESLGQADWSGPSEFIYRGSVGPLQLNEFQMEALQALGRRVQLALPGYRGYLQADLIEDGLGCLWLLEFNPRWTAGMELLHDVAATAGQSPLSQHLRAWGIDHAANAAWPKPATRLVTKAVYYSAADIELDQPTRVKLQGLRNWQSSAVPGMEWCLADVPAVAPTAPMRFEKGSPILTLKSRQR